MTRTLLLILALCMVPSVPTYAAFNAELVDEEEGQAIYFVSYQRGKMLRGGLADTEKKAREKLERKSHEFCLEQGYTYLRFPTLGEIARDEELSAVWKLAAGGEEKNSSETSGNRWSGTATAHKSRDLLLLVKEEKEGYIKCMKKKR